MKRNAVRFLVFPAVLLLLFASACQMKPLRPAVTQTSETSLVETTPPDEPSDSPADFGGQTWRLRAPWAFTYLPRGDGSAWNDRLWAAYRSIAKTYNVSVSLADIAGLEGALPLLASGEAPDVLGLTAAEIALAAAGGYILPVDDAHLAIEGFNPADSKKWHQGLSEKMLLRGRQWSVQVASEVHMPSLGTLLVYNRDIMQSIGAAYLENIAETGKWTWEYYLQLAQAVPGLRSTWTQAVENPVAVLAQNGRLPVMHSKTGFWRTHVKDSQTMSAVAFLRESAVPALHFSGTFEEALLQYEQGRVAFLWLSSETLLATPSLLNQTFATGILPLPQEVGGTPSFALAGHYEGYTLPAGSGSLKKAVTVFNAWAEHFNDQNWIGTFGNTFSLDAQQLRLIKNHIYPNRLPDPTEFVPAIADAVKTQFVNPLLTTSNTSWSISIRADESLSRFLRTFNAD